MDKYMRKYFISHVLFNHCTLHRIMKFAKAFQDDITLDNMDRQQLSAICRLLNLTPIGTR